MTYGHTWKPSKTTKRIFANKMEEINDFCVKNGISQSDSSDSYYFTLHGIDYRVSNHSIFQSNRGAYDEFGNQIRPEYHTTGTKDVVNIRAGKTRIIEIYNRLKE